MQIKEQFDPELRKLIKKRKQVAVIPVGSIEQHGPHLPISTDSDIVSEIAKQVSKKSDFLLLPTLNYGVSFEHFPFFNLSIRKETLQRVLVDICVSLAKNGINTIFVLNGHHGNQNALKNLEQKINRNLKKNIKIFVFSYWHFMKSEFDHAGFVETSIMLTISKKVKMKNAQKGLIVDNMSKKEKFELGRLAKKSFPKITKNGIWGDPRKSNAGAGRKLVTEIVKNITKTCQTCLTGKNRKLHQ